MNYGYTFNYNALPVWDSRGVDGTTGAISNLGYWHMRKLSQFDDTSGIVMLSDRGGLKSTLNGYVIFNATRPVGAEVGSFEYTYWGTNPGWKHLDTSNFLFVDGHVKALSYSQFIPKQNALLGIGTNLDVPGW